MQTHPALPFCLSLALAACNGGGSETTVASASEASTGDTSSGDAPGTSSTGDASSTTADLPTTGDVTTDDPTTGTVTTGPATTGTTTDEPGTTTEGVSATTVDSEGTTTGEGTTTTTGDSTTGTTGDSTGETTAGAIEATIYEIQDGTVAEQTAVEVKGVVVTAVSPTGAGFFAQEPEGGVYSGVWVYVSKMGPDISGLQVGDEVDIAGSTLEFEGLTEIDASKGAVVETGVAGLPVDPAVIAISDFTDDTEIEPWEGVFVRIEGAPLLPVTELPGFEEFEVTGNGGSALVDNLLYSALLDAASFPQLGVGASFTAIQGPVNFSFEWYKIAPRSAADLENYVAPADPGSGVDDLVPGDLVITEVMYDPSCANDDCEWIEVRNATDIDVDLQGLVIQDSAQDPTKQGVVAASVVLPPGGYAVLGFKTAATWPYPNPPAAFYGSNPALGNGGDQVFLKNAQGTLDSVPSWSDKGALDNGVSWKLDPTKLDAVANDAVANWCYSTVGFYMNEKGSPGAVNEAACAAI